MAKDPVNSVAIDDRRRRNFIVDVELLEGGGGWISRSAMRRLDYELSERVACCVQGSSRNSCALPATFSGPGAHKMTFPPLIVPSA